MNDKEEVKLFEKLKNNIISVMVSLTVLCIGSLVLFYFNTTYVLAQNVIDTNENYISLKDVQKNINELKIIPKINTQKIKDIQDDIKDLKDGQKELRKSNQKIIELLYQIKQKQD